MASLIECDDFRSLLQAAKAAPDDPAAFTPLANRITELVVPSLIRKVFDASSQHDVLQEILLAVSRQLDSLVSRDDPECFVRAIAANKVLQYRRHQVTGIRNLVSYDSDAVSNAQPRASTVDSVERDEEYTRLEEFISKLPPELRVIGELRFWKQQSYAEIAQEIQRPVHVVAYRLQKFMDAAKEWFLDK